MGNSKRENFCDTSETYNNDIKLKYCFLYRNNMREWG